MKIISLNAFCGHAYDELISFIIKEAPTTDIFCFQEMLSNPKSDIASLPYEGRANILHDIASNLPQFSMEFMATQDDWDITPAYPKQLQLGMAIFYITGLPVKARGGFYIYNDYNSYKPKDYETLGHGAMFIQVDCPVPLTIISVHGNSQPASKRDTPKRLQQSQKILDFVKDRPGEKIIMGDFNLFPDTDSIRIFESSGFRNLITEYGVKTTRGSLMRKLFPEYEHGPYGFQEFADYAFISPGISVQKFEVPDLPISDHLPMILECEI